MPVWRAPGSRSRRRWWGVLVNPFPRLGYLLFRSFETAVLSLPYPTAVAVSRHFGAFVHAVDRKHRKTGRKNLARAFPEWPERRIRASLRRTYEHFTLVIFEMFFTQRLVRRSNLDRYATFVGYENVERALAEGKGLIVVVGHFGNWEFAAYAGALRGMRLTSIARPLNNRWINDHLVRMRTQTGQEVVYKRDALRRMIGCLREERVLVIPSDQNVRENGVFVPFFGRPASTQRSAALLSLKYGAPLLVATHHRTTPGRFHHRIEFSPPLYPAQFDRAEDPLQEMTAQFTRRLEGKIREHPQQYLWMHKRWKTRPPEEEAERERRRASSNAERRTSAVNG